jgi:hypothetical protein
MDSHPFCVRFNQRSRRVVIKRFPVCSFNAWFAWFYLGVWETDPFNGRRVKFANVSMMVAPTIVAVK